MKQPLAHPAAPSRCSNPLIGKSMVLYFRKPEAADRDAPRSVPALPTACSTAAQVAETAAAHRRDAGARRRGAVDAGEHVDVWNHVEAAMALLVGGEVDGRRARPTTGAWPRQRADGSWPMKIVAGEVEDASGETNMSAYLAVGVWHHWLVRRDERVRASACWPAVRRGAGLRGRAAAAVRRHRLVAGVDDATGEGQRRGAAGRLARASTRRCAPASRSPS